MSIALDATYSLGRNLSGVGVYSQEILNGLARAHSDYPYLFCYRPHRFLRSFQERLPANASRALLWRGWPRDPVLFHGLNQRVDSTRYRRVVSTFHDLFVITGDYSTPEFRERFRQQAKLAAERSDLVIAVSQFTAHQVEDLLRVERSRIRVIYHGVRTRKNEPIPTRTILFVGAIQTRKNVLRLVQAFEQTPPGWKLVLAGSAGYGAAAVLARVAQSPRRAEIELKGYVSPSELAQLYRTAEIFAFPSLDEGFGMPVIEAMSHGIAVLTSQTSALGEISGGSALLVDPTDVSSISAALNRLIAEPQLRDDLGQKGRLHSSKFTWELAVEKTWAVYGELLG